MLQPVFEHRQRDGGQDLKASQQTGRAGLVASLLLLVANNENEKGEHHASVS